ncbi:metalloendopeptidase OMA1, mitochondrial-like [Stegodyphus dumicola]|uniref:metalloendopeptidase OMA1, mitochondrial-like n=1 Tax=Stegodyphus dumicola TaxID=202533 RepID=UPI0015B01E57|nr:metalloendopeptidase OMA1, mitochondrial-like [Stegodyphus dumicola]
MAVLQKSFEKVPNIEFLSTHPSHESRSKYLDDLMDEAIKLRSSCGCPLLGYRDPRKEVEAAAHRLELIRKELFKNDPKPVKIFQI